jgi:hypothetical protein
MRIYTQLNSPEKVSSAYAKLNRTYFDWLAHVIPMYEKGSALSEPVRISTYENGMYNVHDIPGFKATVLAAKHVQVILSKGPEYFAESDAYYSPSVRYLFDNQPSLVAYYTYLRQIEIDEHLNHLKTYEAFVIVCCVVMTFLIFGVAVVVPYTSFRSFLHRQKKIVDMISKIDKKLVMNAITSLEEEIEIVGQEDDPTKSTAHKYSGLDEKRIRPILPRKYILATFAYLALGLVFLFVVVNHIQSTSTLPGDFNVRILLPPIND